MWSKNPILSYFGPNSEMQNYQDYTDPTLPPLHSLDTTLTPFWLFTVIILTLVLTKTGLNILTTSRQSPEKVSALSSSLSSCGVRSIFVDRQLTWLRVNNFWNSVTWSSKGCCYEATFCWLMLLVPRKICQILFNMIPWPNTRIALSIFRQKTGKSIIKHYTGHKSILLL